MLEGTERLGINVAIQDRRQNKTGELEDDCHPYRDDDHIVRCPVEARDIKSRDLEQVEQVEKFGGDKAISPKEFGEHRVCGDSIFFRLFV